MDQSKIACIKASVSVYLWGHARHSSKEPIANHLIICKPRLLITWWPNWPITMRIYVITYRVTYNTARTKKHLMYKSVNSSATNTVMWPLSANKEAGLYHVTIYWLYRPIASADPSHSTCLNTDRVKCIVNDAQLLTEHMLDRADVRETIYSQVSL